MPECTNIFRTIETHAIRILLELRSVSDQIQVGFRLGMIRSSGAEAIWSFCTARDPNAIGKWTAKHPQSKAILVKHLTMQGMMELGKIQSLKTDHTSAT